MLRYYSYYSVGGYKDFFLGSSEGKDPSRYYFPLIPVLEERGRNDINAKNEAEKLRTYPAVDLLTADNNCAMPSTASRIISHAAYKLMFLHLGGNYHGLAIREITPNETDETGRKIPFMLLITSDNAEDRHRLEILAAYMAANIKEAERAISSVLNMNFELNGLEFKQDEFNRWIDTVIKKNTENELMTIDRNIKVEAATGKVALLVLPKGITLAKAVEEQKLTHTEIVSVSVDDVVSFTDKKKLNDIILRLREREKKIGRQNELLKKGLIVSAVCGLIIGGLSVWFLNK